MVGHVSGRQRFGRRDREVRIPWLGRPRRARVTGKAVTGERGETVSVQREASQGIANDPDRLVSDAERDAVVKQL